MHRESRQPRLSCRWSTPQSLQAFVFFAVASELSLGLHDLMLSGCAYSPERHRQKQLGAMQANFGADTPSAGAAFLDGAEPGPAESFEFFVWSRCSFVATFVGMCARPRIPARPHAASPSAAPRPPLTARRRPPPALPGTR